MKNRIRTGWSLIGLLILAGCTASQASNEAKQNPETATQTETAGTPRADAKVDQASETVAAAPSPNGKRMALLVGCSDYDHPDISDLVGPANDVVLMKQLLVDYYDFGPTDIETLANGEAEDKQPTRANILGWLEAIIAKTAKGDQVVVHFSGHGTQQPDADFDPKNDFEPDGQDEVFIPKDAGGWDPHQGTLSGAIIDDEFRDIIGRLTSKGADVWAIFDCCCSGTIGREVDVAFRKREVKRETLPSDLIPVEAIEEARAKAQKAYAAQRSVKSARPDSLDAVRGASGQGGFVATYAARPYEPTIEMYFPFDAAEADQKSYGLLTYTLFSVLSRATTKLTYSELNQRINQQYDAWDRATPRSLVEGNRRDQPVLAHDTEERVTRIYLAAEPDGAWSVTAGALHGLTTGSILRVTPPAGAAEADKPLGCVKIAGLQPLKALVEPAAFEDEPAADPAKLGANCRAEIVFLDYGLNKKKVAFAGDRDSALAAKVAGPALAESAKNMFELTARPEEADWLVRVNGGKAYLHRAGSLLVGREDGPPALDAFGPAPVAGPSLANWITESMERIARAERLLSLSLSNESLLATEDPLEVEVRMIKYKDQADRVGEFLTSGAELKNGDIVGFRLQNHGRESADVTILYIDSGYGIHSLFPEVGKVADNAVHPGAPFTTSQFVLEDLKPGVERVVVIAVRSEGSPIDFSWLEQPTIEQARSAFDVKRGGKHHPLDKLLETAAYGEGDTRAMRRLELDNYSIRSISWTVAE